MGFEPGTYSSRSVAAGLFYEDEWQEITAFRAAIDRVNMDKYVLPNVKLVPYVEVLRTTDGFSLSRKGE